MKQKADPRRPVRRSGDLSADLSLKQLAAVGVIVFMWNDIERLFNMLLDECLGFDSNINLEITSRIHGFDGRLAIIKSFCRDYYDLPKDTINLINNSMSLLGECKSFRDAIIHTRLHDTKDAIGETIEARGQKTHVHISETALIAVIHRLIQIDAELRIIYKYLGAMKSYSTPGLFRMDYDENDPHIESPALELQEYVSQLQSHQKKRRSLPRFPEFPSLPPTPQE